MHGLLSISVAKIPEYASDFHHFKILLACTTLRADPVFRNIIPAGTGRKTLLRQTSLLVIDETAYHTHVLPIGIHINSYLVNSLSLRERVGERGEIRPVF
jgi:hypothetical protein